MLMHSIPSISSLSSPVKFSVVQQKKAHLALMSLAYIGVVCNFSYQEGVMILDLKDINELFVL
jgi:hypothetical protein